MFATSDWEHRIKEDRKNLWLVTTGAGKFVCKKVRRRFYVKDYNGQSPVIGKVLSYEQL